jgi:peptidyl-prolyl cis-trans isomerase D
MLRFIRRHRQSFIVKGIFIVLILVFIGWGVGSFESARQTAAVAVVNGVEISVGELTQAQQNLTRAYQELYGSAFSPQLASQLDLEGRALDDLITSALLLSEAKRLGLRATDEEVADSIRSIAAFNPDGQFNKEAYLRFLRLAQIPEEQFVEQQRKSLLVNRMQSLITDGARVSDAELRDRYRVENERVNLRYVKLAWRDLAGTAAVTDEEISAHYQENADRYREPERVAFAYVAYRPGDFTKEADISEEEITRFYEEHVTERFTDPPQVQLRQLVLNVSGDASEQDRANVRKRAEKLVAQAAKSDFESLVREHSDHKASAKKGGDLGWVARSDLDPQLAAVAFELSKGEISKPIELATGVYILKLEDTRGSRPRALDAVRDEVESSIRTDEARQLARHAADEDAASIAAGATLEELAEKRGLTVEQSKPLTATDFDPTFGPVRTVVEAASRLEVGETSDVVETPLGLFVLRPTEKTAAKVSPLETVRKRVTEDLRAERAKLATREKATQLLERLKGKKDLAGLAAEERLTVEETGPFGRSSGQALAKLGLGEQFMEAAFTLSATNPVAPEVYVTQNGDVVLAVLKERIEPDLAELDEKREALRDSYLQRKKRALFNTFIAQLKRQADIEVRADFLSPT